MKTIFLRLAKMMLSVVLLVSATTIAFGQQSDRYTLHLTNTSGFDIYRIYLSSSDDPIWRRDLLGDSILTSPGSIDIVDIVPGEYDLKLVDEDGDACVKMRVQFFRDRTVTITQGWLIGCEFHNPSR